jgi:hypothetical protein
VTLRTPPNWTAICFAGMLGVVHLSVAVPSLLAGRWACHLSLIIGTICVVACLVGYHCRFELAFLTSQRRVRLRTGVGRFCFERFIPFSGVRAVRIMAEHGVRADHRTPLPRRRRPLPPHPHPPPTGPVHGHGAERAADQGLGGNDRDA